MADLAGVGEQRRIRELDDRFREHQIRLQSWRALEGTAGDSAMPPPTTRLKGGKGVKGGAVAGEGEFSLYPPF